MTWLLVFAVGLLLVAIGVQVAFARTYWAQTNGWTKGAMIFNIVLLVGLTGGLAWLTATRMGG